MSILLSDHDIGRLSEMLDTFYAACEGGSSDTEHEAAMDLAEVVQEIVTR